MNRRKMIALAGGFALGSIATKSVNAQNAAEPWYIDEDELKTDIVLPTNKKSLKSIQTNRFYDKKGDFEKIIKKAEAVYPITSWENTAMENGKPLWYLNDERKIPHNITPRAVNYYFNLVRGKNDNCKYFVGVSNFLAFTKAEETKQGDKTSISTNVDKIFEVTLSLHYGYYCGKLCCSFFDRTKKVIFNSKEEIIALYMPFLSEGMC